MPNGRSVRPASVPAGLGHQPEQRPVGDDEWTAAMAAHGMPEPQAVMLLGMFRASRRGEFDVVSPALGEVLGRKATPLSSFLDGVIA